MSRMDGAGVRAKCAEFVEEFGGGAPVGSEALLVLGDLLGDMDMERLALAGLDDRGDLVAWDGPDRMDRGKHHHRPVACTATRQLLTERRESPFPGGGCAGGEPSLDTLGGPVGADRGETGTEVAGGHVG